MIVPDLAPFVQGALVIAAMFLVSPPPVPPRESLTCSDHRPSSRMPDVFSD